MKTMIKGMQKRKEIYNPMIAGSLVFASVVRWMTLGPIGASNVTSSRVLLQQMCMQIHQTLCRQKDCESNHL